MSRKENVWLHGECPYCGEILRRKAPADLAFCLGTPKNPHEIMEVPLYFAISVSEELYAKIENAFSLKSIKSIINPFSAKEITNRVINELLSVALNDDEILSAVLIKCGKTEVEAAEIVAKLRQQP